LLIRFNATYDVYRSDMMMSSYPSGNEVLTEENPRNARMNRPPSAFRLIFPFLRIRGEIKARELTIIRPRIRTNCIFFQGGGRRET